jgi:hypothetical protein
MPEHPCYRVLSLPRHSKTLASGRFGVAAIWLVVRQLQVAAFLPRNEFREHAGMEEPRRTVAESSLEFPDLRLAHELVDLSLVRELRRRLLPPFQSMAESLRSAASSSNKNC